MFAGFSKNKGRVNYIEYTPTYRFQAERPFQQVCEIRQNLHYFFFFNINVQYHLQILSQFHPSTGNINRLKITGY